MKTHKVLSLSITIIFAITCLFPFYTSEASAAPTSFGISKWKTVKLYKETHYDEYDDYIPPEADDFDGYYTRKRLSEEHDFTVPKAGYARVLLTITPIFFNHSDDDEDGNYRDGVDENDNVIKGNVKIKFMDGSKVINSYSVNMKSYKDLQENTSWAFCEKKCKPGKKYTLKITSSGTSYFDFDVMYKIKYRIIGHTKYASSASIKNKVSTRGDSWVKIGKLKNGLPYYKRLKYNKKYISGWQIKNDGSLYVSVKGKGKTTVTTILKNGKKYNTKVTIKHGYPNFYAYLSSYKTRNNYFTVKIKNLGTRKLSIIRKGAKVLDKDYKSYDRKIKGHKNVVIKPGKTKVVRFYVRGRTTWPNYKHFTLHAHFKYDGKKFKWKTANGYSWYKDGKKWFDTFWDFNEYEDWE